MGLNIGPSNMQYGNGHESNGKTENPVYIFFLQESERKCSENYASFYGLANGCEMAEIHQVEYHSCRRLNRKDKIGPIKGKAKTTDLPNEKGWFERLS